MKIQDGRGKYGDASVSSVQRLNVSAKTRDRMFYISRDDQRAFNAVMPTMTAVAADYVFYLKNTSSVRNLFIQSIEFHSAVANVWRVFQVTGTAAGATAITPSNINLGSLIPAEVTCMGGAATITGLTIGNQIGTHRTGADSSTAMAWGGGLILGPNTALVVEYESGAGGAVEVDCLFHFETLGAS